ncbi:LamG domain-containing protein [Candidatus Woesearchaeota archaeon]|nr:LamG domain-containing protein [Candidatus Woesearchaeota archaeon]
MSKRSQAMMEFLMTYGWALLVVLLAIAGLIYFDVLTPSSYFSDSVDLGEGLLVTSSSANSTHVRMVVKNGLGSTLTDLEINVSSCGTSTPISLGADDTADVLIECETSATDRIQTETVTEFKTIAKSTKVPHTVNGIAFVKVKDGNLYVNDTSGDAESGGEEGSGEGVYAEVPYSLSFGIDEEESLAGCSGDSCPSWDATNGYYFDSDDSISLDTSLPNDIGTNDFTLAMWLKPDTQVDTTAYILEQHLAFPWTGLFIAIENNQNLRFRTKDWPHNDVTYDISSYINDGQQHHFAFSREGLDLKIYIDGTEVISETQPEIANLDQSYAGPPTLGQHCEDQANTNYKGYLKDFIVSTDDSLTAQQISDLYDAGP